MNISWLTLRDLEYLLAVAEHGHFGRAAEACHVSQPALSAQIRKIEEFLETPLFERSNRRVVITPTGEAVVAQARIVLEEAERLRHVAGVEAAPLTQTFRLGAIATLGPYLMPHLLSGLRREFPQLELLLREGLTEHLIAGLREGALDAVLASPTFDDAGLVAMPLFFEPFWLAAPAGHRLLAKTAIRARDLDPDEMVLLEDGHCLRDQALEVCGRGRVRPRAFHATSLETLRHLVASGHGYTLMPHLAVRPDARIQDLLEYRGVRQEGFGRRINLYCRLRYPRLRDCELLADFVRGHLPEGLTAVKDSGVPEH